MWVSSTKSQIIIILLLLLLLGLIIYHHVNLSFKVVLFLTESILTRNKQTANDKIVQSENTMHLDKYDVSIE